MVNIRILSIIAILCLSTNISYGQGIVFFHGTYEEILAKATLEKKNIFVDVYTTWCGPCKKMAADVFPLKEVGDFYNKKFVCIKLDAENEKNHGFFKRYKAQGFPTYFWLSSKGELLDLHTGMASPTYFIDIAGKAAQSELWKKEIALKQRWDKGERSYELFNEYVIGVLQSTKPDTVKALVNQYLTSLNEEQRKSDQTFGIICYSRKPEKGIIFDLMTKYQQDYEQFIGYPEYKKNLYRYFVRAATANLSEQDTASYRKHVELIKNSIFPDQPMFMEILDMEKSLQTGLYEEGFNKMKILVNKYAQANPYLPNEFFYSMVNSKFLINAEVSKDDQLKIIGIAEKSFEFIPSKQTVLYLGCAYAKAGNYKKAYEVMATIPLYPDPILPGGLYKFIGLNSKLQTEFGATSECKEIQKMLIAKKEITQKGIISRRTKRDMAPNMKKNGK
jgi:thiol-disulfide isomerase/thioredoxin